MNDHYSILSWKIYGKFEEMVLEHDLILFLSLHWVNVNLLKVKHNLEAQLCLYALCQSSAPHDSSAQSKWHVSSKRYFLTPLI